MAALDGGRNGYYALPSCAKHFLSGCLYRGNVKALQFFLETSTLEVYSLQNTLKNATTIH